MNASKAFFIAAGGPPGPPGANPYAWATAGGANFFEITTPGLHQVVPPTPPGKVRVVGAGNNMQQHLFFQANDAALDCSSSVGTFTDLDIYIGAQKRESYSFQAPNLAPSNGYGYALLPGENLSVDIGSIDAPATRIVGFANWQDYDAATFIIANFSLNEVNQVVMPPVPAGKVALMGPLPIVNTLPSPFIDVVNLDDITHNVTLETAFRPDGSFTSYAQLIDPGNRAIFGPQFIVGFGAMLDSNVTLRMRTTLPISTVSPLARVCHRETDNP